MPSFNYRGEVMGAPRPRVTKWGTYMPKKYVEYKEALAECWKSQVGCYYEGAVCVEVRVYRHLPKSRPKKLLMEQDTFKPDADNIAKGVLDALNGLAWKDDSQVVDLWVKKYPRSRMLGDTDQITVIVYSADGIPQD